MSQNCI